MSRRLVGLFVAANADGPFIRVEAAHSFGEFLVANDAAGSLFHSKHPTWLKVRIVRTHKGYTHSPWIARGEIGGLTYHGLCQERERGTSLGAC
jgi:hypothetical protein